MLPIYREVCDSIPGAQNTERCAKKSMGWNPWMSRRKVSERETQKWDPPKGQWVVNPSNR